MIWEALKLAVKAIFRNALRSFLTVLGIVIGVAAVIAIGGLSQIVVGALDILLVVLAIIGGAIIGAGEVAAVALGAVGGVELGDGALCSLAVGRLGGAPDGRPLGGVGGEEARHAPETLPAMWHPGRGRNRVLCQLRLLHVVGGRARG